MANSKFIKAYCNKTKKYFGLECREFSGEWKVVNFIDLKAEEAAVLTSEIEQPVFKTNSNLIPCDECSKRVVGGCSCPSKHRACSASMPYNFQCIYCNELVIDYEEADVSDSEKGKTITLSQGQEVVIRGRNNKPLSKIYVGCGWEASATGTNIDVDSSVILYDRNGNTSSSDVVYYGNLTYGGGAITHHGDNLVGHTGSRRDNDADDENISINLSTIPANRESLLFVINIYNCVERRQTFATVRNLYIRIKDPDSKKTLIEYRMDQNFGDCTALIVGVARRKDRGWSFKAIGEGVRADNLSKLVEVGSRYLS
jgi:stress response protein SCP2